MAHHRRQSALAWRASAGGMARTCLRWLLKSSVSRAFIAWTKPWRRKGRWTWIKWPWSMFPVDESGVRHKNNRAGGEARRPGRGDRVSAPAIPVIPAKRHARTALKSVANFPSSASFLHPSLFLPSFPSPLRWVTCRGAHSLTPFSHLSERQACRARAPTQQIPSRIGSINFSAVAEMDTCSACVLADSTLSQVLWPSALRIRKFLLKGIPPEVTGRLWLCLDPCQMERGTRPPWMGRAPIAAV